MIMDMGAVKESFIRQQLAELARNTGGYCDIHPTTLQLLMSHCAVSLGWFDKRSVPGWVLATLRQALEQRGILYIAPLNDSLATGQVAMLFQERFVIVQWNQDGAVLSVPRHLNYNEAGHAVTFAASNGLAEETVSAIRRALSDDRQQAVSGRRAALKQQFDTASVVLYSGREVRLYCADWIVPITSSGGSLTVHSARRVHQNDKLLLVAPDASRCSADVPTDLVTAEPDGSLSAEEQQTLLRDMLNTVAKWHQWRWPIQHYLHAYICSRKDGQPSILLAVMGFQIPT